jgi:hypothetical protein
LCLERKVGFFAERRSVGRLELQGERGEIQTLAVATIVEPRSVSGERCGPLGLPAAEPVVGPANCL